MTGLFVAVAGTERVAAARCLGLRRGRRLRRMGWTSGSCSGESATEFSLGVTEPVAFGGVRSGELTSIGTALTAVFLRDLRLVAVR
jgi:hypothetical protein